MVFGKVRKDEFLYPVRRQNWGIPSVNSLPNRKEEKNMIIRVNSVVLRVNKTAGRHVSLNPAAR